LRPRHQVPCGTSRVVLGAHRVVGPGTHRGSGPREVHTTLSPATSRALSIEAASLTSVASRASLPWTTRSTCGHPSSSNLASVYGCCKFKTVLPPADFRPGYNIIGSVVHGIGTWISVVFFIHKFTVGDNLLCCQSMSSYWSWPR
jgi:hypothetical protein